MDSTTRIKLIGTRTVDPDEFGPDARLNLITSHRAGEGGRTDGLAMTILECGDAATLRAVQDAADADDAITEYETVDAARVAEVR